MVLDYRNLFYISSGDRGMFFLNRAQAGERLAEKLVELKGAKETVVMGLARGGVAVAAVVAQELGLPLGVSIVRKVGAPGNPELAIGAVAQSGEAVFNERLIALLGVSKEFLLREVEKEKKSALEREQRYFKGRSRPTVENRRVILIDDGIATGASMRVAIRALRAQGAREIVLAVPVAAPDSLDRIGREVDRVVCLHAPDFFEAVGAFYKEFDPVSDDDLLKILLENGA